MIKVIVGGGTVIKNAPIGIVKKMERELIFPNPKYEQALKQAERTGYMPADIPKKLYFFDRRGGSIITPRGYTSRVLRLLKHREIEVIDRTVTPEIDIEFNGELRDYQQEATDAVMLNRYGILEAATGSGKTVMGTALTAMRKVKTLVIVHNTELLNQWIGEYVKFTNLEKHDIGIIGGGKYEVKDVTIGIINSVHKKAVEFKNEFGFVIYDECHRAISPTWILTSNTLKPKFHTGLSATPYRSDGNTKALYRQIGPQLHKVDRKHLEDTGAILIPDIIKINTRFAYKFNNDYSSMLSALTKNDNRNITVANAIVKEFQRTGEPLMVVSDRVAHCELLRDLIDGEAGIHAVVLSGKVSKAIRKRAVADVKAGTYNVLVSTVSLLGEGFDSPNLNGVFLTTPIKFGGRLVQSIGRVLRPSDGGNPRVFDFRDNLVPVLRYSGFARDKVYKAHKWKLGNIN